MTSHTTFYLVLPLDPLEAILKENEDNNTISFVTKHVDDDGYIYCDLKIEVPKERGRDIFFKMKYGKWVVSEGVVPWNGLFGDGAK